MRITGKSCKYLGVSTCFSMGLTNDQIRILGRWKSGDTPQYYRNVYPGALKVISLTLTSALHTPNLDTPASCSTPLREVRMQTSSAYTGSTRTGDMSSERTLTPLSGRTTPEYSSTSRYSRDPPKTYQSIGTQTMDINQYPSQIQIRDPHLPNPNQIIQHHQDLPQHQQHQVLHEGENLIAVEVLPAGVIPYIPSEMDMILEATQYTLVVLPE